MTALLWVLIFGVAYPLVTLAVWCLAAFGLAASRAEVYEHAKLKNDRHWPGTTLQNYQITGAWFPRIILAFLVGALWPVGLPIWLSWKRGSFIATALEERAALAKAFS